MKGRIKAAFLVDHDGNLYAANDVSQEEVHYADRYGFPGPERLAQPLPRTTFDGLRPVAAEFVAAQLGMSSPEGSAILKKQLQESEKSRQQLAAAEVSLRTQLDTARKMVGTQHAEIVEKTNALTALQGHVPNNTMTAEATTPITAPILPGIGDMLKQAGKAAAGATVLSIVTKTASEAALKAGLPAKSVEHPFFQGLVKLAAPAVLTAVAQRTPYIKNITGVTQVLQMAQLSAVMTVAQDTVDALFDSVKPAFQAIASVIETDAIEAPPEEA